MEEQNSKHISQKCFPVAQTVEHGASNAKVMGVISSESKNFFLFHFYCVQWKRWKCLHKSKLQKERGSQNDINIKH